MGEYDGRFYNRIKKTPDILRLRCTKCGEVQETYSEIVYSQGERVCLECKKKNRKADNRAYDNYVSSPR